MTFLEQEINQLKKSIFAIKDRKQFNDLSLRIFYLQAEYNAVYKNYLNFLGVRSTEVTCIENIPFLPITFFKSQKVITGENTHETVFVSSGTGNIGNSQHFVKDLELYKMSFLKGFNLFFGDVNKYCFLGLLPSYLERSSSSLVYMVKGLMDVAGNNESGFYLEDLEQLSKVLLKNETNKINTFLIGVSFALLDLVKSNNYNLKHAIVMETGGMKGRRKELIRNELHDILKEGFNVKNIASEYGMTELLSQAYAVKDGLFKCPPWMDVFIRELNDPFALEKENRTGGINIIDLANLWSCSFIETKDVGRRNQKGQFEVLGRMESSDLRGCNLLLFD